MKNFLLVLILVSLSPHFGCATTAHISTGQEKASLKASAMSEGLPHEGLWRENLALTDMDNDGYLDIVAPPPRKDERPENRPSVFIQGTDGKWRGDVFAFPGSTDYGYGGVAAADTNKDGLQDLIFAVHTSNIILLQNSGNKSFIEQPFPKKEGFHSRAVDVGDIDDDGWPDIVSLHEGFPQEGRQEGILIAVNKGGKDWDTKMLRESAGMTGDSLSLGDFNGDGCKDIADAPQTTIKERQKLIWFGDCKGGFDYRGNDFVGAMIPFVVRTGDVDGDGKDEIVYKLSGVGAGAKIKLSVYQWLRETFGDVSAGLEEIGDPIAYDLADIDNDGRPELIVLRELKVEIYGYRGNKWVLQTGFPIMSTAETIGAFDLRAGRNRDGSVVVVYNLGRENPNLNKGLRAFILK
ncbi:MAG: VCBS repeat-containing protein [Nitrospirota bacterium]